MLKVTKSQDGEQKSLDLLTLQEAASKIHPKWQGGLLRPPINFFHITWIGGQNNLLKFGF